MPFITNWVWYIWKLPFASDYTYLQRQVPSSALLGLLQAFFNYGRKSKLDFYKPQQLYPYSPTDFNFDRECILFKHCAIQLPKCFEGYQKQSAINLAYLRRCIENSVENIHVYSVGYWRILWPLQRNLWQLFAALNHFLLRQRYASVMLQYSSALTILTKTVRVNVNFYLRNYSW